MGGKRVQRHVSNHPKLRETLAQGAGRTLGNAFGVPGLGGVQGLEPGGCDREQRQRRDPQFNPLRRLLQQQINGQTLDTRHRRHRLPTIFTVEHKHRQDQIIHRQDVFTHQTTGKIITTVAAQTGSGKQALGGGKAHGRLLSPA